MILGLLKTLKCCLLLGIQDLICLIEHQILVVLENAKTSRNYVEEWEQTNCECFNSWNLHQTDSSNYILLTSFQEYSSPKRICPGWFVTKIYYFHVSMLSRTSCLMLDSILPLTWTNILPAINLWELVSTKIYYSTPTYRKRIFRVVRSIWSISMDEAHAFFMDKWHSKRL